MTIHSVYFIFFLSFIRISRRPIQTNLLRECENKRQGFKLKKKKANKIGGFF